MAMTVSAGFIIPLCLGLYELCVWRLEIWLCFCNWFSLYREIHCFYFTISRQGWDQTQYLL